MSSSKTAYPTFDSKLLLLIDLFEFDKTTIGDSEILFYVTNATILCSPNRIQESTGVDKQSLREGLIDNKKFGCNMKVNDSSISPLAKWKEASCGG